MKKTKKLSVIVSCLLIFIIHFTACENNSDFSYESETQSLSDFKYTLEDCGLPSMPSGIGDLEDFYKIKQYESEQYRSRYDMGVCCQLCGEQTVVLFFLDDDESQWDSESISLYTKKHVGPALDFLLKESDKWGNTLSFDIKRYSAVLSKDITLKYHGRINENLDNGGSSKDIPDQIAKALGYRSGMEMLAALELEYSTENIIPLVFVNKSGLSYARNQAPYTRNHAARYEVNYLEHAVVFSSDISKAQDSWKKDNSRSATIAHEFLHLFGAEDLYKPDNRLELAEKYYMDDIMLLDHYNISRLAINDITAYQIGWNHNIPSICYEDEWS